MREQDEHDLYWQNLQEEAEQEAEYYRQYYDFLDSLIADKNYFLHGIYTVIDLLNSNEFATSGLKPLDFLIKKKDELEKPIKQITKKDDLPF